MDANGNKIRPLDGQSSVNDKSSGNVVGEGGTLRATLKFFAWADKNPAPESTGRCVSVCTASAVGYASRGTPHHFYTDSVRGRPHADPENQGGLRRWHRRVRCRR